MANELTKYSDLITRGVTKINGSYAPNQYVKFEDIVINQEYKVTNNVPNPIIDSGQIGITAHEEIICRKSAEHEMFVLKIPKNHTVTYNIPYIPYKATLTTYFGTQKNTPELKFNGGITLYQTPCDANGNKKGSPTVIESLTTFTKYLAESTPSVSHNGSSKPITKTIKGGTSDAYVLISLFVSVDVSSDVEGVEDFMINAYIHPTSTATCIAECTENK